MIKQGTGKNFFINLTKLFVRNDCNWIFNRSPPLNDKLYSRKKKKLAHLLIDNFGKLIMIEKGTNRKSL